MPRTIMITGASGGLGAAVCAAFVGQGDRVLGIARPPFPAGVDGIAADLTTAAGAAAAIAEAERKAAGPVHALIHLVGAFAGGHSVAATDDATWRAMLTVNLDAAFYTARAALPLLLKQPGGRLVMIGARAAVEPGANLCAYNASKAGLIALVKTMAAEIGPQGATANIILPATMDTPANRAAMPTADPAQWVRPAAVAELIIWLASEAGGDVNGAALPVYGRG